MTDSAIKAAKNLVKHLCSVRDRINVDLEHMTAEQRTEYFKQMREKSPSAQ